MTRGSIVFFTCLFSMIFLGRRQFPYHFLGVFLVSLGIFLVGLTQAGNMTAVGGVVLCLISQVFAAAILVIEEKILVGTNVAPLLAVGLEGTFGVLIMAVMLPTMSGIGRTTVMDSIA